MLVARRPGSGRSRARWPTSSAALTLSVGAHVDHVGPGHHDLAGDGVAELDDRLDELPLLVLDHSSSAAASTMPSSSSSDTNGPCFSPLPGSITLARPMRPGRCTRSGGKRDEHQRRPRRQQRGPVGVEHGPRLRERLGEHEEHDHVQHETDDHTDRAEQRVGEDVVRNACTVWRIVIITRSGLMNRSGCSTNDTRAAVALDGSSSASVMRLAPGDAVERGLGDGEVAERRASAR